jgi:hypothetical protein
MVHPASFSNLDLLLDENDMQVPNKIIMLRALTLRSSRLRRV